MRLPSSLPKILWTWKRALSRVQKFVLFSFSLLPSPGAHLKFGPLLHYAGTY